MHSIYYYIVFGGGAVVFIGLIWAMSRTPKPAKPTVSNLNPFSSPETELGKVARPPARLKPPGEVATLKGRYRLHAASGQYYRVGRDANNPSTELLDWDLIWRLLSMSEQNRLMQESRSRMDGVPLRDLMDSEDALFTRPPGEERPRGAALLELVTDAEPSATVQSAGGQLLDVPKFLLPVITVNIPTTTVDASSSPVNPD